MTKYYKCPVCKKQKIKRIRNKRVGYYFLCVGRGGCLAEFTKSWRRTT